MEYAAAIVAVTLATLSILANRRADGLLERVSRHLEETGEVRLEPAIHVPVTPQSAMISGADRRRWRKR